MAYYWLDYTMEECTQHTNPRHEESLLVQSYTWHNPYKRQTTQDSNVPDWQMQTMWIGGHSTTPHYWMWRMENMALSFTENCHHSSNDSMEYCTRLAITTTMRNMANHPMPFSHVHLANIVHYQTRPNHESATSAFITFMRTNKINLYHMAKRSSLSVCCEWAMRHVLVT
jgi:hypothetical protein